MYLQSFPGLMSLTLGDGTTQRRDDTLRQFVASSASGSLTEVVPYGEDENAAAMRTIVFHLVEQAGPRATGSIRTPQTEGSRP